MTAVISHNPINFLKRELADYKKLFRSLPALVVSFFVVSVIITNLMAAKFVVSTPLIAVTGGVLLSWLPFLCMDIVTKHFGAKAAIKLNIFGLFIYLLCVGMFELVVNLQIDTVNPTPTDYSAFNSVFSTQWWILVSSSTAFVVSGIVNAVLNSWIGKFFKKNPDGKAAYMSRCYISTFIGQFVDNFVFVGLLLFGLSGWHITAGLSMPVVGAALLGGFLELLTEVIFSPIGYRIVKRWREENVGADYISKEA